VRSRSRQNVLQDELETTVIEFEPSPTKTPTSANLNDNAKQRTKKSPGDRHPAKMSAAALDKLMAST
jgi:hypothetical protein